MNTAVKQEGVIWMLYDTPILDAVKKLYSQLWARDHANQLPDMTGLEPKAITAYIVDKIAQLPIKFHVMRVNPTHWDQKAQDANKRDFERKHGVTVVNTYHELTEYEDMFTKVFG